MRLLPLLTLIAAWSLAAALVAAPTAAADPAAVTAQLGPISGPLRGDLDVHDPALVKGDDGNWYVYSSGVVGKSGGTVQVRKSVDDGHTWTYAGTVWTAIPGWLTAAVPGTETMWAPEIHRHGGTYYLYYAVSTLGHNNSIIALATNTTLDPADPAYRWVDQGQVIRSMPDSDFNAIDPDVVEDASGTPWLVLGSYWSGIQMVQLAWPTGKRSADRTRTHLADRKLPLNAIEGPVVVPHGGWYYLFTSWDRCCMGVKSTYKVAVGRSKVVTGPYVDRAGKALMDGGGTIVLASTGSQIGPGGESVSGGVMAYHYYDATAGGAPRLGLRNLSFTADGWPQLSAGYDSPDDASAA